MKPATAMAPARTKFDNILYATDFSPAAAHAIPFVKKFAKHFQSKLVALHVRPPVITPVGQTQVSTWEVDLEATRAVDEYHRQLLVDSFSGIETNVLITEGSIQEDLKEAIEKNNTDLVIIGTRGRTGLIKMLLGSVAEEIFRTVPCPVLTVGPHAENLKAEIHEILFATDFATNPQAAVAYAVSLAQEFQARLTLLHVVPEPTAGELVGWHDLKESSKNMLENLVPEEAKSWCKPESFVEVGEPAERIVDLAHLREVDLIVLGAQPESGVPGAATHLPTSTAHKVVAHASCPVLTVRNR